MTTISIAVIRLPGQLPEADKDILLFIDGEAHADLGAYLGLDNDNEQMWVDSMGARIHEPILAWCEMPCLPAPVTLNPRAAWPFPVEAEARN